MNKEYMLQVIHLRQADLEQRYKLACRNKNDQEEVITAGAAAAIRTQCKRDLHLLRLLELLVLSCPKTLFIDDVDAEDGFQRLCEPNERFRKHRG